MPGKHAEPVARTRKRVDIDAWPCGAIVNFGFTGFDSLKTMGEALKHWDTELESWYRRYVNGQNTPLPALLNINFGGPQIATVDRTCDLCIQSTQRSVWPGTTRPAAGHIEQAPHLWRFKLLTAYTTKPL